MTGWKTPCRRPPNESFVAAERAKGRITKTPRMARTTTTDPNLFTCSATRDSLKFNQLFHNCTARVCDPGRYFDSPFSFVGPPSHLKILVPHSGHFPDTLPKRLYEHVPHRSDVESGSFGTANRTSSPVVHPITKGAGQQK